MSTEAKLKLKGYITPVTIVRWVKELFDPTAISDIRFDDYGSLSNLTFKVYENYRNKGKWTSQYGFIEFTHKRQRRRLFYMYSNINTHENLEYYTELGLAEMVTSETTHLSLGNWGAYDEIMMALLKKAGGGWYDKNDCDDEPYRWVTFSDTDTTCSLNVPEELEFLLKLIRELPDTAELDNELSQKQLQALWTAFCLHEGLEPDTATYDNYFDIVHKALLEAYPEAKDYTPTAWFDSDPSPYREEGLTDEKYTEKCFDLFMGALLS